MSANLGCYGDSFASTPHLDRFASESIRFTQAYASAPVCSPARCCLITGMYATSLGTQRLRSHFALPEHCKPFPELLRSSGYYTSNNVKTDYNIQDEKQHIQAMWSQNGPHAHWRQRKSKQPFFAVFNLMTTHQSRTSVWPHAKFEREVAAQISDGIQHQPADVRLPPYYPDTPTARREMARYYDCIRVMDQQVGKLLRELDEHDLAEETIVFFFSDHGMGMPRGKRLLHDSGMHVPLIIRIPEKFKSLKPADVQRHSNSDVQNQMISFVDFAPSVLACTDVETPPWMQGQPFIGPNLTRREYVYGARDRVDEVYDFSRSVRDHRYLYIRNYMPHLSWMPPEWYSDHSALRREIATLRDAKRLNSNQLTFAADQKPVEELYDASLDPFQLDNLADDPRVSDVLQRMRSAHRKWVFETRDIGFLPESIVWDRLRDASPWDVAQDHDRYALDHTLSAAQSVGRESTLAEHTTRCQAVDPAVRFWGVISLRCQGKQTTSSRSLLLELLNDPVAAVRIEAASALLSAAESQPATNRLLSEVRGDNVDVILRAMRALQLNSKTARPDREAIQAVLDRATEKETTSSHPCWMFVRFSADALLKSLNP